jgi:hypothetical protein
MSRGSWLLLLGVVAFSLGCRASADDCRDVAAHVMALAQAEGKSAALSVEELEGTCNEQRPTRGLMKCMLGAQRLGDLEGC